MTLHDQFANFFSTYNGKPVEVEDPSNLDQCFDLAFAWVDWLKIPRETIRHLNAYQIWTQPQDITLTYFDYIPSTPSNSPLTGDIVVFSTAVGVAGHVCIANGTGDANSFTSFDQNWSGVQYARLVVHKYPSVLGWLRVKSATVESGVLEQRANDFVAVAGELGVEPFKDPCIAKIRGMNKELGELSDTNQALNRKVTDEETQVKDLQAKLTVLENSNKDLQKNYDAAMISVQADKNTIKDLMETAKKLEDSIATEALTPIEHIIKGFKELFRR